MTSALGCTECGRVVHYPDPLCDCPARDFIALTKATDVLSFKLRHQGRHAEATRVDDAAAILAEHTA